MSMGMYLNKVNVLEGQSLLDIAIQACGSVEAAYQMAVLNGQSITDVPAVGAELIEPDVVSKPIASYYASKGIKPATASNDEIDDVSDLERIFFPELPVEFS